jgi:hypothetical protein
MKIVKTLEAGEEIGSDGFNFVLSGRLRSIGDGRVIHCRTENPDKPPACIISADIDRVRVERPRDGASLAEWSS